ncbi:MAG: amino acid permease [Saprospiraceae bacterium]|nr:amino acid permease [Saprospiraceae bacterium]
MAKKKVRKFGTFKGVFTPTALTILGVIMYLRHPWVVGNAGVFGALGILVISIAITLFTGLSMSSMTTNIRIGAGGPFSIIAQSLGLEIGGSIGIPLYLSQACVVAMYIFGFREGWMWIFPDHNPVLIDFTTFVVIAVIAFISTDFAFKIQYVILAIIFGSLISIFMGLINHPFNFEGVQWFGEYQGTPILDESGAITGYDSSSFWEVFAVFFPAVTGVMVGANMSGELENPKRNIPVGTLSAIVITAFIYLALIFVAVILADTQDLIDNYTIFIDRAYWRPIVIAGLLGATFSSALASFVGAPRILQALAEKNILPYSGKLASLSKRGEPINALVFSAFVIVISLLFRNLNAIAPLITMFFLITYAMINLVVLIEKSLSLPSFRPTLFVPLIVPLLGAIGCFFVMFILNPVFSLVSFGIVIAFYAALLRRELTSEKSDARSGLFTSIAQWATKQSNELSPRREARAWQPELLIPVESPKEVRGVYRLIYAICRPKGSVKILGMERKGRNERLRTALPKFKQTFDKAGVSTSYAFISGEDFGKTVSISMQALETAFFKPNTVFLTLNSEMDTQDEYLPVVKGCRMHRWGLLLFAPFEQVGLGIEKVINVWLDIIPDDWEETLDLGNNDLALLSGLIIRNNWRARLNLIKTMRPEVKTSNEEIRNELERIKALARISKETEIFIIERNQEMWEKAPVADLNIMELPDVEDLEISRLKEIPQHLRTSCLFTVDSRDENALV